MINYWMTVYWMTVIFLAGTSQGFAMSSFGKDEINIPSKKAPVIEPAVGPDPVAANLKQKVILGESLEVREAPQATATAPWALNRGEAFEQIIVQGDWSHIKNERGEGWIPTVLIREIGALDLGARDPAADHRKNITEVKAESDDSFGPAKKNRSGYKVNFKAVHDLERLHISDRDLTSFQNTGKLGTR